MQNNLFLYSSILTLFVFSHVIEAALVPNQTSNIVAIVEGIPIYASEIKVAKTAVILQFKLLHGHEPLSIADTNELQKLGTELSGKRFLEKACHTVFEKKKADFGFSASDAEIKYKWNHLTNGVNFESAITKQHDLVAPRIDALKAVFENGQDKDLVYDKMLKGILTKAEWEVDLNYYSTPERRKMLEQYANQTVQDLQKPPPGISAIVVNDKIDARIDAFIAKNDTNFANYIKLAASTNYAEINLKYPLNYLAMKRAEWWREQYRKAAVNFYDDKYKQIWDAYVSMK